MFIFSNILLFCALTCVLFRLPSLSALFVSSFYSVSVSCSIQLFVTPWTHQASLSIEFSRQEYWGGWPFPSPGDLSHSGAEPSSPALQADSFPSEPPGKPSFYSTFFSLSSFLPRPDLVFYSVDTEHSAQRNILCASCTCCHCCHHAVSWIHNPETLIIFLRFLNVLFSVSKWNTSVWILRSC